MNELLKLLRESHELVNDVNNDIPFIAAGMKRMEGPARNKLYDVLRNLERIEKLAKSAV